MEQREIPMSSLIRIGVLDEQEVVHSGLRACFSELSDMAVVGAYFRPDNVLYAIERGDIDLLLMDPVLKYRDNFEFIRDLHIRHSGLRILVYTTEPCTAAVSMLLDAGVHGIVCKCQPLDDCVHAIRLLAAGQCYCGPIKGRTEVSSTSFTPAGNQDAAAILLSLPALSSREREVLRLRISGLTVTCIAELVGRSLKTVSTQKQAAYRKLGLKSDMDLFRRLARYEH